MRQRSSCRNTLARRSVVGRKGDAAFCKFTYEEPYMRPFFLEKFNNDSLEACHVSIAKSIKSMAEEMSCLPGVACWKLRDAYSRALSARNDGMMLLWSMRS